MTGPITGAIYPRLTQLATIDQETALSVLYHQGAQHVSVITGSAAIMLVMFGGRILTLWMGTPVLAGQVAPIVAVMALGTLLNGLMVIPYQLQLAHGRTSLTLQVNCAAVVLLVPAIWLVVPIFGAIGAAWVWVILNVGYVIFEIALMHRRLLPKEKWRWYREDVGGPLAGALVSGFIFRRLIPSQPARPMEFLALPTLRLRRSGRDCEFGCRNHISRSPCYDNSQENSLSPLTGQSEPLQAVPSPVISTLIPTFRRPALLERAIRGALGQTHQSVRVCVYDNASGDDTAEVVRRIAASDSRVVYSCNPSNIGGYPNIMRAMSLVDTPYFSILSDDDVLLPDFYATALEGFRKHPDAMMSVTATLQINGQGTLVKAPVLSWKPGYYTPPDAYLAMLDHGHPEWMSVLFRREVLDQCGTLDEETGAPADLDYLLRVASRFPVVVSTDPGAIFVVGAGYSATPYVYTGPGWLKMIRNQTSNSELPPGARRYGELVLTKRLTDRIFITNGFYAIVERRWEDARVAARTLGTDHGLSMRASILRLAIWVCERLPLAHRGVVAFCEARRVYTRSRRSQLQKDFGSYASYLGHDPEPGVSGRIGA